MFGRGLGATLVVLALGGAGAPRPRSVEVLTRGPLPCAGIADLHRQLRIHLEARHLSVRADNASLRLEVGAGPGGRVSVSLRDRLGNLFVRSIQVRQEDCPALAETIALVVDSSLDQLPWHGELPEGEAWADGGDTWAWDLDDGGSSRSGEAITPEPGEPEIGVTAPTPGESAAAHWTGELSLAGGAAWGPAAGLLPAEGKLEGAVVHPSGWALLVGANLETPVSRAVEGGRIDASSWGGALLAERRWSWTPRWESSAEVGLGLEVISAWSQGFAQNRRATLYNPALEARLEGRWRWTPNLYLTAALWGRLRMYEEHLTVGSSGPGLTLPNLWLSPEIGVGWQFF
jgi:hypothetical protein